MKNIIEVFGEYLGNFVNPYLDSHVPLQKSGESWAAALQRERDFVDSFCVGEPRATATVSVAELRAMGYVGLYAMPIQFECVTIDTIFSAQAVGL